tara:strand:- start:564 stop:2027 length:1464 start_codon:yes stop_codon:yes gene_type:complete
MPYLGNRPDNIVIRNAQQEFNYTATSSQTTFTGLDTNNNTLAYNPGNVEVFFNGARLEEADFTATNGTSIVLASAASTNDLISIVSTDVFEVTDTVSRQNGGTFIGDVTMSGNLTVNGTTTSVNSNEVNIGDNILKLNSDETGTPSQNAGIEVERGSATNVVFRWNETSDKWQFTNDGSSYIDLGESDLVGDTSPQLGGDLYLNSKNVLGNGNIDINGYLSGNRMTVKATAAPSTPSSGEAFIYASKTSGNTGVRIHASGSSEVLEVRSGSSGTNLMYLNNQGNVSFAGEVEASYFVDSSNNSYYLDPSSTGTASLTVAGKIGVGTTTPDEMLQVIGSVDIGPTTIPWTRSSSSGYNSLSLSGDNANSSGFLYLGNGASATNADFDLYRILGHNGATQVSQISTVTNTSANDDGRIEFYTKSTGASMSSAMTIEADGRITAEKSIITNPNTISTNTTLPSSSNSMAIGPITLNATLTIPNGSTWTIV